MDTSDLALGYLCDQFDVYLPDATAPGAIDGLDIAMAYLRGHAQDVMGIAAVCPDRLAAAAAHFCNDSRSHSAK
jgi:hypothetical protein